MPKREKPFHLDMPFDEALRRYVKTVPQQLPNPKKIKRKQPKRTLAKIASSHMTVDSDSTP